MTRLARAALVLLGAWATLAIFWSNLPSALLRGALAVGYAAAWLHPKVRRTSIFLTSFAAVLVWHLLIPPRTDRDWSADQDVLPEIRLYGERFEIDHVRDFGYRDVDDFLPRRVSRSYDWTSVEGADFVVERFGAWEGAGHSFVTFSFSTGERLAISIEIRKEKGEQFGALKGIFKRFELMYVIGTERDLIGLRRNVRGNDVAVYPIRASKGGLRGMLSGMLARAKKLRAEPEFYNTLWNACTTNLADHVNAISPRRVAFSLKTRCAGYADVMAYELGLIDTDASLEALRERHRIPVVPLDAPDYSAAIRAR